ncbi:MAG: hypothetical protein WCB21_07020 [Azonexus sp.]
MAVTLSALDDRSLAESASMRSPTSINDAKIPADWPFGEFDEIAV